VLKKSALVAEASAPIVDREDARNVESHMKQNQKVSPSDFADLLLKCPLIRPVRPTVFLDATAIVTFGNIFESAIKRYLPYTGSPDKKPLFILAGMHDKLKKEWQETAALHNVDIIPVAAIASHGKDNMCLYVKNNDLWGPSGLDNLVRACSSRNIFAGYFIDATVVGPLFKTPQAMYLKSRFAELARIYNALEDQKSKETFVGVIKARETGDPGYIPIADYRQYFHPVVSARVGDTIIEGGLAQGYSTRDFAKAVGPTGLIFGFEPMPAYAASLKDLVKSVPTAITIIDKGLWSCDAVLVFTENGPASRVSESSDGTDSLPCTSIDTFMKEGPKSCSLIKLDIEGSEIECLHGSLQTITQYKPKLMISLYHDVSHYIDIPLLIMDHFPEYKLYMGHHGVTVNETILYATV
jgi:FkbM family methyltransferase